MSIIIAMLVFGVIVVIHEFGHFIVARKCGICVEEFAIGMGPAFFKKQKGETLYTLRLFPLGGFCKMLGEDGESKAKNAFCSKTVFQRILVVVAGAFMNFLLSFVVFIIICAINGVSLPVVSEIMPNMPAESAGLQVGDRITKIDDVKINIYDDLSFELSQSKGKSIVVEIERGKENFQLNIVPSLRENEDGSKQYLIGFLCDKKSGIFDSGEEFQNATIVEVVKDGFFRILFYIKATLVGVVRLVTMQSSMDDMAGAIGIVKVIDTAYDSSMQIGIFNMVQTMLLFTAVISANLGVFNLLPLPALDGGRLVFLIIEAIRRKPIDGEKEGMIHFAGFVLLMILAAVIAYNDIIKLL